MNINQEDLEKLSFLQCKDLQGRAIPLIPLWDGSEWHMWIPTQEHGLFKMRPVDIGRSEYFAKTPAKQTDLYIPFIEFMKKRAYWPDLASRLHAITGDIHNLGTSLAKVDIFFEQREQLSHGVAAFVETEVEYIFMVCRSLFDLLQAVIANIWKKVRLHNASLIKKDLRSSFGDMVSANNKLSSLPQIQKRFSLPEQLARFYFETGPFFQNLREGRNAIVHHGKDIGPVFVIDRGFALDRAVEPFASFGVWREEHVFNEKIASLRPLLAHVIFKTIFACNDFVETISKVIEFPPDIAPDFHVFTRGSHNEALVAALAVLRGGDPWWV